MQIDRRQLALPVFALGLLSVLPAFAGADEDAIAKNLEAFRVAQKAGNAEALVSLLAAGAIMRVLGDQLEAMITRILGVLLAALAAQYVIDGVKASFG